MGFHQINFLPIWLAALGLALIQPLSAQQVLKAAELPPNPQVEYVIHVSIDGLTASMLEAKLAGDTAEQYAAFQRLIDEGASTFNARTDYDTTVTLPNHVGMLTARPLWQPEGVSDQHHHGFPHNALPEGTNMTLHNAGNTSVGYIYSVFDVVHDHGLTTALYASKERFNIFEKSYNDTYGRGDSVGEDNGRNKIDRYAYANDGLHAQSLHALVMEELPQTHPNYTFVHYADPDLTGHVHAFGSDEYFEAVEGVNDYLADLMTLVETDPVFRNNTVMIVTSDHGGTDFKGHGDQTMEINYRIPLFVWGQGVAANADLYDLNPTNRQDPGVERPTFSVDVVQPLRNGETGTLALELLGLPSIPWSFMTNAMNVASFQAEASALKELFLPVIWH